MTMKKLHPGVKWSWRLGLIWGILFFSIFISFWIGGFVLGITQPTKVTANIFLMGFLIWFVIFICLIILGEIWVRMAYNRWLYEFTLTNLKIERGVIWKRYSNVPYERVQNVDIHRGVIARILGFSSVLIQTAGYSGGYGRNGRMVMPEGYIPAVNPEEAEEIRNFVMKKITRKKSGL